ncbi:hypothetical protein TeGR_g2436 [Tetraparma gracilis]|uniref:Endonuclease/exonuclease/phosphatase domain-containing protein n=1 Tax=Tetraparma gracilis TaxID=2962635 RepID=A0ABQ6MV65_9STRA|nr:hypothetical protein TeGR_g2436 [Tetraparma gracilis]
MSTLSLLQINVWSGSTYSLSTSCPGGSFLSYELPSAAAARYSSLLSLIRHHDPDVLTVQEAMPLRAYSDRLARDLGYDCYARTGVAGIVLGPLHVPSSAITEGDAILARRGLGLRPLGRARLTGCVYGERLSFNLGNATQALAAEVTKEGRKIGVACTHWTAGVLEEPETRRQLEAMKAAGPGGVAVEVGGAAVPAPERAFTAAEIAEGEAAVRAGTATRVLEAARTAAFLAALPLPAGAPLILAGDLNTVPGTPEIGRLAEAGYEAVAFPPGSKTWDVDNPCVRLQDEPEGGAERGPVEEFLYEGMGRRNAMLDHVFVKGGKLEVEEAKVCMRDELGLGGERGMVWPSDHLGLMVTFKI